MRRRNTTAILLIVMMIAAAFLAGCGKGQPGAQEDDKEASIPGGHEAYGFSYSVPETDCIFMFNADQLGSGDEWVDLEISGRRAENGLEAVLQESCDAEYLENEGYELKDSGEKTVGGKSCYWYELCDEMSDWTKVLLIPQADEKKYIEIRSDFIEDSDKDKADAFFDELLNGLEFRDDEGYIANKDYLSIGGVRIPAQGLNPSQFFYGLMDLEATDGLASVQIDFDYENYAQGVEKTFNDMEWDDNQLLLGDGSIEVDGVKCKWYRWLDEIPDMLPYLSHIIMIPVDDLQTIMSIDYNFDGDVEDVSRYDDQIKGLEEQIHVINAR